MSTRTFVASRTIAAVAALALVVGACSKDAVSTADPTTPSVAPTSSAPATTTPPTTTEPPVATTTTAAASTTTEPTTTTTATTIAATTTTKPPLTPASLTLASNGVLPFMFGETDGDVIAGLTTALGAPDSDEARTYPTADGDSFVDTNAEESFTHPIGRTVCFTNKLCAQFGGATVDTLIFTGWDLGEGDPQVFTAEGITVGSVMSDFVGVVALDGGGCYWVGWSDVAGVELTMSSAGEPFGSFDPEGNYVIGNPAPADVTVLALAAGDLPFFLYDDC
jgi:hypothetical protein